MEAAGAAEATAAALAAARRGGTALLLGLPPHGQTVALPPDDVVNNDLTILGSFGYTSRAWRDVVTLLNAASSGRASWSPTATRWPAGSRPSRACAARSPRGKVLLEVR